MIHCFRVSRADGSLVEDETFKVVPAEVPVHEDSFIWLDFDSFGDAEYRLLRDGFQFHPLAVQDCAEHVHFPKIDDYGSYLYLVLHAVDPSSVEGTVRTVEVDAFLGKNCLITYHDREFDEFDLLKKELREKTLLLARGPDFLLHALLDRIVVKYFPRLDAFEDRIDALENSVLDERGKNAVLPQIIDLKREIVQLKRIIHPQRELFLKLSRPEFPDLIDDQTMLYFRDTYDQVYRISELVDGYREMLSNLLDAHYAIISYRMNDIIRVLTVFTTVLMPLTFITGLFGMNFEFMPLIHGRGGFLAAAIAMGVVAGLMTLFFKHKRWL